MGKKVYLCSVSSKPIPEARVEFLMESGIPEHEWTTVEHSLVKKKKGLFMGEVGTSELKIVDELYNDSVRSMLKSSESSEDDEDNDLE